MTSLELIRTIILAIGWPVLILGSVFVFLESFGFYKDVKQSIFGKLILIMTAGQLVTMFSLGIVATAFMVKDASQGVPIVVPIFFAWFITMVFITRTAVLWNREAVRINALYQNLEILVKERTKELEQERSRLQAIVSSMGEGLLVVDRQLRVVLANNAAGQLLGTSSSDFIGQELEKIVHMLKNDRELTLEEQPHVRLFASGTTVVTALKDHLEWQTSFGRRFPVALVAAPLRGDGITGAVIVFRDITVEQEIDQAKSEFVSVASHQLRTPLTAIRLFVEMMMSGGAGELTSHQQEYMRNVQESTQRMIRLVNDLLNISRIETGKLRIEPVPTRIESLLKNIVAEVKPLGEEKACAIVFEEPSTQLPMISVDSSLLRQVIHNFLTNAVRYSPQHKCDILVKAEQLDGQIVMSVRDQGIGIPIEVQQRIFEKFFRAENAVKTQADGTGMGMYIARTIMEQSGGKIWFESELGRGSTFFASLPLGGMVQKAEGKTLIQQ